MLVTVFGTASRATVAVVPAGTAHADARRPVFVAGADTAFLVAAALLALTLVVVLAMVPPSAGRRLTGPPNPNPA